MEFDPDNMDADIAAWREMMRSDDIREIRHQVKDRKAVRLSKLIELYIKDRLSTKAWGKSSVTTYRQNFKRLVELLEDKDIRDYNIEYVQYYREILDKLPKTFNTKYREMFVDEVLQKVKGTDYQKISPTTVSKRLQEASSLFKWAKDKRVGGLDHNPFKGSAPKTKIRPDKQRRELTDEEIRIIFKKLWIDRETFQYWIPIIAAYSGMRQGEIAQLDCADIRQIDDVWCFDITDEGDTGKSVKTANGTRIIPIHSKLVELGFLDCVRASGDGKLFKSLKPTNGKWGHQVSKFFSYFRKKIGLVNGV